MTEELKGKLFDELTAVVYHEEPYTCMDTGREKIEKTLINEGLSAAEAVSLIQSVGDIPEGAIAASDDKEYDIRKIFPVSELPKEFLRWDKKTQEDFLWEAGLNTKTFGFSICVGEFIWPDYYGKKEFNLYVSSSERVDVEYTSEVIEGRNIASVESRFYYMQEELRDIQGARGKPHRKKA